MKLETGMRTADLRGVSGFDRTTTAPNTNGDLAEKLPHNLAGSRNDWRGDVESAHQEREKLKIDGPQVGIAAHENLAFLETSFREDERVVELCSGQEPLVPNLSGDSLHNPVRDRRKMQRLELPRSKLRERPDRRAANARSFSASCCQCEFLEDRWRDHEPRLRNPRTDRLQCIGNGFDRLRQIQKNVGISGDEHGRRPLPTRR